MKRKAVIDFVERVGSTFVVAFIGVASVSGVSDVTGLKAAGIAGALSAGKFAAVRAQAFLNTPEA
jgi:hypothetical protein